MSKPFCFWPNRSGWVLAFICNTDVMNFFRVLCMVMPKDSGAAPGNGSLYIYLYLYSKGHFLKVETCEKSNVSGIRSSWRGVCMGRDCCLINTTSPEGLVFSRGFSNPISIK